MSSGTTSLWCSDEDGGCPIVTDNTFDQGSVGVLLKSGASGSLTGNQFFKNSEALMISGQNITTVSSQNTFQDNGKGVVLRLTDNIVVEGNTFGENDNAAVCCEEEVVQSLETISFVVVHGEFCVRPPVRLIFSRTYSQHVRRVLKFQDVLFLVWSAVGLQNVTLAAESMLWRQVFKSVRIASTSVQRLDCRLRSNQARM